MWDRKLYAKARDRAASQSVHELLSWADQAGTEMAAAIYRFRKDRNAPQLDEVRTALIALAAVVDDIAERYPG